MNLASSDIFSGDHGGSQVSSTSTSSTSGIARTIWSTFSWIIGPTGQPIDVSVWITLTLGPSTSTSYSSPSSTMSIPSSGSSTARSASTTSSFVGIEPSLRTTTPLQEKPYLFLALAGEEVDAVHEADPVAARAHHDRMRARAVGKKPDAAEEIS